MSGELETAYRRLSSISSEPVATRGGAAKDDNIISAISAIGAIEGFHLPKSPNLPASDHVPDLLQHLAIVSGFRFRSVALDGAWWRQEGPPLLVRSKKTGRFAAAIWTKRQYHLRDPDSEDMVPFDQKHAESINQEGYQLYPGLPDQLTFRGMAKFALSNSFGGLRAIVLSAFLAMIVGLVVPIGTAVVVSTAIPDGRVHLLGEMAVLVAAGALGIFALNLTQSFLAIRLETLVNIRLQAAIWDRLLRLPLSFFRQYQTGDLVRRVMAVDEARRRLTNSVFGAVLTGAFSVVSFALMLIYDARLALFGGCFAAVSVAILTFLAMRQLRSQAEFRDIQGKVTGQSLGLLSGIEKLRIAAAEERAFLRWATVFSRQQRTIWHIGRVQVLQTTFLAVVGTLGILGAILVAGVRSQPISLSAFAAFNAAFGQFVASISSFGISIGTLAVIVPLARRAAPIIQSQTESARKASDPGRLSGEVTLKNVSFRYAADGPFVLKDINLKIEAGAYVALVGPSGAGKSTLLRLLLGFEEPASGSVFYDSQDLSSLDIRLVRRQIGTVLQSIGVTPGTIYENIAGARALSDDDVMEAARSAAFADDIESFPMGLNTFVSEGGGTLSGGQRQRLMIARALVGHPRILFFDEATSALDNRTQAQLKESIDKINASRLVIAHRLSTIRDADKIIVLEDGRIVETGDYESLMDAKGPFYSLAKRQLA
ncbi:NHLP bacteriocin export ABC transporter permease/ATPase subunit [Ruegeria arenilitoris]|uniref:NHLP bacteriocin export ABC transporter permease/ATPase subunit n=1 Tax=Ruegeria arenilitoris TaxID=1173585 RepID=UPI00147BFA1D